MKILRFETNFRKKEQRRSMRNFSRVQYSYYSTHAQIEKPEAQFPIKLFLLYQNLPNVGKIEINMDHFGQVNPPIFDKFINVTILRYNFNFGEFQNLKS